MGMEIARNATGHRLSAPTCLPPLHQLNPFFGLREKDRFTVSETSHNPKVFRRSFLRGPCDWKIDRRLPGLFNVER